MKKIFIILITVWIFLSAVSCQKKETDINKILAEIYEIKVDSLNSDVIVNYKNPISDACQIFINPDTEFEKTCNLFQKNFNLCYTKTKFHPISDFCTEQYSIAGSSDGYIEFYEDGSFFGISNYVIATLDVAVNASSDRVLDVLKAELSDLLDDSVYPYVNVTCSLSENVRNQRFGMYTFVFYNMYQDYHTDFVRVCVMDDGTVNYIRCWKTGIDVTQLELNIDKAWEEKLILRKLNDMLGTKYQSYETVVPPEMRIYDGEVVIKYSVAGIESNNVDSRNESDSFAYPIMIPVRLLKDKLN